LPLAARQSVQSAASVGSRGREPLRLDRSDLVARGHAGEPRSFEVLRLAAGDGNRHDEVQAGAQVFLQLDRLLFAEMARSEAQGRLAHALCRQRRGQCFVQALLSPQTCGQAH
jgi:hypothetical protein